MRSVKEWANLDYYTEPFKVDEENRLNFISAIITRLYNLNKETKTLENKNLDKALKQEHLTVIKKSIHKLRENNIGGKGNSPFERKKSVSKVEYKETLFFIEYPECAGVKKYHRSHIIDYDILSSLNLSASYEMCTLKNLTLLLWTLEKTCCYASSAEATVGGKVYPGNNTVSLDKHFVSTRGIQNVKVFRKNQTDGSSLTAAGFDVFRKNVYEIKELLVNGTNNQEDKTKKVLEDYRSVYTDIETATGQRMNNSVLNIIFYKVLNTLV